MNLEYAVDAVVRPLESDSVTASTLMQHGHVLKEFTVWFERTSSGLDGEFFRLVEAYRSSQLQAVQLDGTEEYRVIPQL